LNDNKEFRRIGGVFSGVLLQALLFRFKEPSYC
jgi:hypothetical protein